MPKTKASSKAVTSDLPDEHVEVSKPRKSKAVKEEQPQKVVKPRKAKAVEESSEPVKKTRKTKAVEGESSEPVKKTRKTKAVEEGESSEPVEKPPRAPRVPLNLDTMLETLKNIESLLTDEVEARTKARSEHNKTGSLKNVKSALKLVKSVEAKLPKLVKKKQPRRVSSLNSGFKKPVDITDELAAFIKVEPGTQISRNEITQALCVYIHFDPANPKEAIQRWKDLNKNGHRDLREVNEETHKTYIKPDAKLSKLLGYDTYVKDVKAGRVTKKRKLHKTDLVKTEMVEDDPSLHYYTIQKLIQKHIISSK